MHAQISQCIQGLIESACIELFQSLNCSISRINTLDGLEEELEIDTEEMPLARIDGGSDELEILLFLKMPFSVLALTYPVTDVGEEELEDWVSDLSSQLIGRLKTKLLEHNCDLAVGLPNYHFGDDIRALMSEHEENEHFIFYFDVDNEIFEFGASIEFFKDSLSFSIEATVDSDAMAEGDIELF